ncbi:glycosyl hydrolase family 43 [Mucilaginibacter yixingensis]|uniref:Glycosyl hydrolase family 43 n=1 Tax=Mucilaginibacter yixingensis TaxID=1295612 RepID=A0A2T5J642_9SPHI|nr:family 43 glycosylhydrolase [Mucilaginibacter yixingensis]PTQ93662.1 glycosyl hydrolase family 43 [Mucilaginibacter yixingensis]
MLRSKLLITTITFLGLLNLSQSALAQKLDRINPGEVWPDDRGAHIQAHGGGITKVKDTYYWYGEERRQDLDSNRRYVSCYASKDLTNWKFKGDVVAFTDPENLGPRWILERPKVFFSKKTGKYVMYFHLDNSTYKYARVGIAISDKPDGKFSYLKSFRPLGHESRDIGQFIDDDGAPYLIFEDRPLGFHIVKLTADCLDIEKEVSLIREHMEGGAIVHYKGLYYAIGSALTGWRPNPNRYATARSLEGPWSEFQDLAPKETNTYGSQSTLLLKVAGRRDTTILFLGDIWKPKTQWDSRYLWMPVEIGSGKLWLPQPGPFKINVREGTTIKINN